MSVTLDANVLIYATNESEPVHHEARQLLERLAAGPDLVYLFWPSATSSARSLAGWTGTVPDGVLSPRPQIPSRTP